MSFKSLSLLIFVGIIYLVCASVVHSGDYKGLKHNQYLFNPPIDDSMLKGKLLKWNGVFIKKTDDHYLMKWDSSLHPNVIWAFVNPNNVDLSRASDLIMVIGKYLGRHPFITGSGSIYQIPVLEAIAVEPSDWGLY